MDFGRPRVLIPAYGRKYRTEQDCVDDYVAGVDFKIDGGPYCSCRDFPGEDMSIRYGRGLYTLVKFNP